MKTPSFKTLSLSLLAGAAVLSLSTIAQARGPGGQGMERPAFEEVDANADGSVTLEEIQAYMEAQAAARFAAADTNGDGGLSPEEIATAAEGRADARAARRFERMDANSDGLISQDELQAGRGDGPRGEGRRGGDDQSEGRRGDGHRGDDDNGHRHGGKKHGGNGEGRGGRGGPDRMFDRADADNSGGLSLEEWNAMGQGRGRR